MPEFSGTFIYRDIPMPESKTSASISSMPKNVSVQTSITLSESVPGQKLCVELSEDGADKPLQTKLCKTNADGVAAVDFVIENPKLWWPNDYGDQPLYIVRTTLLDEDGTSLNLSPDGSVCAH